MEGTVLSLRTASRRRRRPIRRLRGWAIAAGAALAAVAGSAVCAQEAPTRTRGFWLPERVSTIGDTIDGIFFLILGVTGVVFVLVEAALLVFLVKYRHREGRRASYVHGNNRLEMVWTALPAVFLAFLAFMSQRAWSEIKPAKQFRGHVLDEIRTIEIVAQQFAWNIRYPGRDGLFGRRSPALVTATNPIGLDLSDPASLDDITTINQLHFPAYEKVRVRMTSLDVLHSFFLPEFRMKQDAVPGMEVNIVFDAKNVAFGDSGEAHYEIACAELCGLGHYRMKGFVTVHRTREAFDAWLDEQAAELAAERMPEEPAPAAQPAEPAAPMGEQAPAP
jgi:cytochrome c oxidase subunit 2